MEKRIQTVNKSPIRYKQITHLIFLICFAFYNIVAYAPDGDKATLSISFEGTGPLAKEAASK